jgi:DNA-directed RNA polymerase subunit RPC12/RpoP
MDSASNAGKPPDKVGVLCTRCRVPFREKVRNVRDDSQLQCPNCNRPITFSSDSADSGVQRGMIEARRTKNGLMPSAAR